ncbi:PGBD4 protein, partial [Polypterus senegalus]|nr:piggyBac transposable element-derived protein 4-like isoform X1 [Polypterus senegalus]MBN3292163.1 PGBD4 protein [Polypterus senegalus]
MEERSAVNQESLRLGYTSDKACTEKENKENEMDNEPLHAGLHFRENLEKRSVGIKEEDCEWEYVQLSQDVKVEDCEFWENGIKEESKHGSLDIQKNETVIDVKEEDIKLESVSQYVFSERTGFGFTPSSHQSIHMKSEGLESDMNRTGKKICSSLSGEGIYEFTELTEEKRKEIMQPSPAQQAIKRALMLISDDESESDAEACNGEADDEQNEAVLSDISDSSDPKYYEKDLVDGQNLDEEEDEDEGWRAAAQATSPETPSYKSKSGLVWSSSEPPPMKYTAYNRCQTKEGPCGNAAQVESAMEALLCFIDNDMLRMMIENTNKYAQYYLQSKGKDSNSWTPIDDTEMMAVIGVLYLLAVYRAKNESVRSLWSSGVSGRPVFRAAFSINRFEQIMAFLRFDDWETCLTMKATDKFAPFQSFWSAFIENCKKNYVVGDYVTIGEQLIPFRGRCSFRQFMPSKPDKYGLKLFLMCDVATSYTFNGMPYVGHEGTRRCTGLAEFVVNKLVEPIHNSGINVTIDKWFTSARLAGDLLSKHLTLLGTVRRNKTEVPREFLPSKTRGLGSSLFGFCRKMTMVSYVPKKNKADILLSSLHQKKEIDQGSRKPIIILDYNKTKDAVDRVNSLCQCYSVQKRTKRWPLVYFFNCLNLAGINALVVFLSKFPDWEARHTIKRRIFLEKLGLQLLRPWLERRIQLSRLPRATQTALKICGVEKVKPVIVEETPKKRRRCHICPASLGRKTVDCCSVCLQPCCNDHKTVTVVCDCCAE